VSEQPVEVCDPAAGRRMTLRRIRLELDEPTEDGETEILLPSDLPEDGAKAVSAKRVADAYHQRWSIEHAFEELTLSPRGEINTLGYPGAALLGFCPAIVAYNLVALVTATLAAVHGRKEAGEISCHQLAREWAAVYEGMIIATGSRAWAAYRETDDAQMVGLLKELAGAADLRRYRKVRRGPKKRPHRSSGKVIHHVATARLLASRKQAATAP
jgi:hypothetical protein